MVVKSGQQGIPAFRFLFGAAIFLICLYGFYIIRAKELYPELFLMPVAAAVKDIPCAPADVGDFQICLPEGIHAQPIEQGALLSSFDMRISGSMHMYSRLPQEDAWRASLERSVFKGFLGDVVHTDTFTLMERIIAKRYNPFLLGIKAGLLPEWMRGKPGAEIIAPASMDALIFSIPEKCQGLLFVKDHVVVIEFEGEGGKTLVPAIFHSVSLSYRGKEEPDT